MSRLLTTLIFLTTFVVAQNNAEFVNPFVGTGGHGHTFPGAVLPFGMVQLSPDTRIDGSWDGCSGYHYDDTRIYGFSHTHLSGTGCSDWGDILLMPIAGKINLDPKLYASTFSHQNEKASAGFYEVFLDQEKIKVELTATQRAGIHRYSFPDGKKAQVLLDLLHRDKTLDCAFSQKDASTIAGMRVSEAWAKKQTVYFAIRFSKPIKQTDIASGGKWLSRNEHNKRNEQAVFTFELASGEQLTVKVALSGVSEEGAIKNLDAEAGHWDFEGYKEAAKAAWNKELSKIQITTDNEIQKRVFYTALYHCMIHPSLNMDVDGQYRGRDDKIHKTDGFTNYSVFSLWDTHRALHPLLSIIDRKRTGDFINSFLVQYQQSGRLPMWELSSNETDCMIGFHAVSVIADAYKKGIRNYDVNLAYEAMKAAANYSAYSIPVFNQKFYLQVDDENENVSKTLEYAYDNWCVAQMAFALGKNADGMTFLKRSLGYKNLFDPKTGCMRPRKNGNWLNPFDPAEINNNFTEGNSWQYSFFVPQDISGLIKMHGGPEQFEKKLDELFTVSSKTSGRDQADVTGLIGQYAHGNEPSHHMAYLYSFVARPEKTRQRVDQICKTFYTAAPGGLIGNEDCGQMSAWYVCSALGFYEVCPGTANYILTPPQFSKSEIHLENGRTFVIRSEQKENKAVSGLSLAGRTLNKMEISNEQMMAGDTLKFLFGNEKPNLFVELPKTEITAVNLVPAPLIISSSQIIKDKLEIKLSGTDGNTESLFYTTDGSEPGEGSKIYSGPFDIETDTEIKVRSKKARSDGTTTSAKFYKIKYDFDIHLKSKPDAQYAAEGEQTLIDGIPATTDWKKGNWLGMQGKDFECEIDLKKPQPFTHLGLVFLQDSRSWILYPTVFELYGSLDNKNFTQIGKVQNTVKPENDEVQMKEFAIDIPPVVNYRYLRLVARSAGKLPAWHQGAGGESHIFVAELNFR